MSIVCEVLVFLGDPDFLGFSLHLVTVDTHTEPHTQNHTLTLGTATLPGEVPWHTLIYTHMFSLSRSLDVVEIQQSMDWVSFSI